MSFEQFTYIKEQLKKKLGFEDDHAADAANRLIRDNRVYDAASKYLHSNTVVDLVIAGHSVNSLINDYKLEPIGAYLMLAEFAANPQKGEQYLTEIREYGHGTPKYEDGELREIIFTTVPAAEQKTPTCPKCGKDATWIPQYQRWYCHNCKEYI